MFNFQKRWCRNKEKIPTSILEDTRKIPLKDTPKVSQWVVSKFHERYCRDKVKITAPSHKDTRKIISETTKDIKAMFSSLKEKILTSILEDTRKIPLKDTPKVSQWVVSKFHERYCRDKVKITAPSHKDTRKIISETTKDIKAILSRLKEEIHLERFCNGHWPRVSFLDIICRNELEYLLPLSFFCVLLCMETDLAPTSSTFSFSMTRSFNSIDIYRSIFREGHLSRLDHFTAAEMVVPSFCFKIICYSSETLNVDSTFWKRFRHIFFFFSSTRFPTSWLTRRLVITIRSRSDSFESLAFLFLSFLFFFEFLFEFFCFYRQRLRNVAVVSPNSEPATKCCESFSSPFFSRRPFGRRTSLASFTGFLCCCT